MNKKIIKILESIALILAILLIYYLGVYVGVTKVSDIKPKLDWTGSTVAECQKSCKLFEVDKDITFSVGGIYYTNWFYCVNIENANMSDVKYRENHELCHHFVEKEYEHFCKNI